MAMISKNTNNTTKKLRIFDKIKWYELIISFLPISLVVFGGLYGWLFGIFGSTFNLLVFTSKISTKKKYVFFLLIIIGSYIVFFIFILFLTIVFYDDYFPK